MLELIELTTREYAIAFLLSKGLTNKEIANQTGLSEGSVKVFITHIMDKTGYRTRLEVALAYINEEFCECNRSRGVNFPSTLKNREKLYGVYGTPAIT